MLPIRKSCHEEIAVAAANSFWDVYGKFLGDISIKQKDGILGDKTFAGPFVTYTMPDTVPERIENLVHFTQFAFHYDDVLESMEKGKAERSHKELLDSLSNSSAKVSTKRPTEEIFARLMLRFTEIDKLRGIDLVKAFHKWIGGLEADPPEFGDIDQFINFRYNNAAAAVMYECVSFGAKLERLTQDEHKIADPIARLLGIAGMLANDYFSWEKEVDEHIHQGGGKLKNTTAVIIETQNLTVEEAKEYVKQLSIQYEQDFLNAMSVLKLERSASNSVLAYLKAQEYMAGGVNLWHSFAKRYDVELDTPYSSDKRQYTNTPSQTVTGSRGSQGLADADKDSRNGFVELPPQKRLQRATDGICASTKRLSSGKDLQGGKVEASLTPIKRGAITMIPDESVVMAPYRYTMSLPSKNVRERFINSLNSWSEADAHSIEVISNVMSFLHNSSLMLDDIEDGSSLRRGQPAVHRIFGISQTINSANYIFLQATAEVLKLGNPQATLVFIDEVKCLHIGQSLDLYWRDNVVCPTEEQYLDMVAKKTGGLFRLVAGLLQAQSLSSKNVEFSRIVNALGWYFQIRDDYQNLKSEEYNEQKGFCEDLDEGKFSMPLIHCIRAKPEDIELVSILRQRALKGSMDYELKVRVLKMMEERGSLKYTYDLLSNLEQEILVINIS